MFTLTKKSAFATLALTVLAAGAANAQSTSYQTTTVTTTHAQPGTPQGGWGPHDDEGHHGEKMFDRADANHDGFITLDELLAMQRRHTEKMFKEADTNHDGKLSHEEMHTWHEAMRARMMQRWEARKAAFQERNGGVNPPGILDANHPVMPNQR